MSGKLAGMKGAMFMAWACDTQLALIQMLILLFVSAPFVRVHSLWPHELHRASSLSTHHHPWNLMGCISCISVMPISHHHPVLFSFFLNLFQHIEIFCESAAHIRWPKYWNNSADNSGLISPRLTGLISPASRDIRSLLHFPWFRKHQFFGCSAFFYRSSTPAHALRG